MSISAGVHCGIGRPRCWLVPASRQCEAMVCGAGSALVHMLMLVVGHVLPADLSNCFDTSNTSSLDLFLYLSVSLYVYLRRVDVILKVCHNHINEYNFDQRHFL